MTKKTLFVATIFNLKIKEKLTRGLEISDGLWITNDTQFISSLINEEFSSAIGVLEKKALLNPDYSVFYSIKYSDVDENSADEVLMEIIKNCNVFLNDMWLIKDHCVNLMLGFLHFPFDSKVITSFTMKPITHSNAAMVNYSDSQGNVHKITEFSKEELNKVIEFFKKDDREIASFKESSSKESLLKKEYSRSTIADVFLQTARIQNDVGVKISHYCTVLEALFSTNNFELTHKLSERIAYFLEDNKADRKELFQKVKDIYGIRSQVVHGSAISKYQKLPSISKNADDIIRRIYLKLKEAPELDKYFRFEKPDNNDFEKYLNDLIFN